MSRIVYGDLWGERRAVALKQLSEDVGITEARFGTVLPGHLVEFAQRMAHARARRLRAA